MRNLCIRKHGRHCILWKCLQFFLTFSPCINAEYDFGDALDKSLLFYEAQRSGDLPESEMRIKWRADSALTDKGQNGEDLTGGYYDGNNKKNHIF